MSTAILEASSNADLKLITTLARKMNIKVFPVTKKEMEEIEDLKLLHLMQEAKEEGLADTKETLEKLGIAI